MQEASIHYSSQGKSYSGYLVQPAGSTPLASVLVLHGGSGLGEHERERARRLAAAGYLALAPDLFGEVFEDREHGIRLISELVREPETLRERTADALGWFSRYRRADPHRMAAIGFCFGGFAALELARAGALLRAVVSFHGSLHTKVSAVEGQVVASILVCSGAEDPHIPSEQRSAFEAEFRTAKADWLMEVYGGAQHAFTVQGAAAPGCAYDAAADRRSWSAMEAFLAERLGRSAEASPAAR